MEHELKNRNISIVPLLLEYLTVFLTGAAIYLCIELLWRGYSHVTMFAAGGLCLCLIYFFEKRLSELKILFRCIIYALYITAVEFVFGVIFNVFLGLAVWDYSEFPLNIMGQICPQFFFAWVIVAYPAIVLCHLLKKLFAKINEKRYFS